MINPHLSIRRIPIGANSRVEKFAITDGAGERLALCDTLYDAAIVLRFIAGKSMSRLECDLATDILKELDGKGKGSNDSRTEQ